jgi:hypothetical protein
MRIIGCDLHASQQSIAMLDQDTGETLDVTLKHEGTTVRDFYAALPRPVVVGIEATGSMRWFLMLMEELGITCHVGHPATIRASVLSTLEIGTRRGFFAFVLPAGRDRSTPT